jgi:hypothetical protein
VAQIKTVSCDNCGKQKGEVNHWWSIEANIRTKSMFICPLEEFSQAQFLPQREQPKEIDYIPLSACGLECLGILESKVKEGKNPLV